MRYKSFSIRELDVNESCLVGPFAQARYATAKINQQMKDLDTEHRRFSQRQMLMTDPKTCETVKIYAITRLA